MRQVQTGMSTSRILPALLALTALAGCPSSRTVAPVETPQPPTTTTKTEVEVELPPEIAHEIDRLVIGLLVDDVEVQAESARELGELGSLAATALPDLAYCLEVEGDPHSACADAIVAITDGDADMLASALQIPLPRKQAVIAAIGEHASAPRPLLSNLVSESCRRAGATGVGDVERHWLGTAAASLDALDPPAKDDEPRPLGTVCSGDVGVIAAR